jgi:hypothetical protein
MEVLKDSFYSFNNNWIFDYLIRIINDIHNFKKIEKSEIYYVLYNIVFYNLYNKDLMEILSWFIADFGFLEIFK